MNRKFCLFVLMCLGAGFAGAQIRPPFADPLNQAGLPDHPAVLITEGANGRVSMAPGETTAVPNVGALVTQLGTNRFRGNVYEMTTETVLAAHDFYLERAEAQEVRMMVYGADAATGPYTRISDVTVQAGAGNGFVSSGDMEVILEAGRFYLIGAAWLSNTGYTFTNEGADEVLDFGTMISGYIGNSYLMPDVVASVPDTVFRYRQRLRTVPAASAVLPLEGGALRMESAAAGSSAVNMLDLELDVSGMTSVTLRFEHRSSNDAVESDGVYLFNDAFQSVLLAALPGGTNDWAVFEADVVAAAVGQGWNLAEPLYVVFQQQGDQPWPDAGREFRRIELLVPPDLRAVSLAGPAEPLLFRGFSAEKTIPLNLTFEARGGAADLVAQPHTVRFEVPGLGTQDVGVSTDVAAFASQEVAVPHGFVVSSDTKLTNYQYAASGTVDAENVLAEAVESNNTAQDGFFVNHYSGTLRFGTVGASIFISAWAPKNPIQANMYHRISGTGFLNGRLFTFTDLEVVKDLDTLDYSLDPALNQEILLDGFDERTAGFVRYRSSGGVTLNKDGVFADVVVTLPSGFGWASAPDRKDLNAKVVFQDAALTGTFAPAGAVSSNGTAWYAEETKPVMIEATGLTWDPAAGTFTLTATGNLVYVREGELADLESSFALGFIDEASSVRRSNELYYRFAEVAANEELLIETGSGGQALMSIDLDVNPGEFRTHFPYDTNPSWNANVKGVLSVVQDYLAPGSVLTDSEALTLSFNQACPDGCPTVAEDSFTLVQVDADFLISAEGGLVAEGLLQVPGPLEWGALTVVQGLPPYAQSAGSMNYAKYLASGHFLRGAGSVPAAAANGPGFILNTGVDWENTAVLEAPFTQAYYDGEGIYPGLNFRQKDHANLQGQNVLGGKLFGPFELSTRSKYYVRESGVTGIHEAVSFNTVDTIYDYPIAFTNLGFSYLSSAPVPDGSRTNGNLTLGYPMDEVITFERLNIRCNGELEDMRAAPGKEDLLFAYWDVDFFLIQMGFERRVDECGLGTGTLVLRGASEIEFIPSALYGTLAVSPTGRILPFTQNDLGYYSRFEVPSVVDVAGTSEQAYAFLPVHEAYLNDYDSAEPADQDVKDGYFSLAGHLDVPFFEAMKVQFHFGTGDGVLHMAGGWPTNGWRGDADTDFFNRPYFDPGHVTRPAGVALAEYRSNELPLYRPRAIKHIAGITAVDYPMAWSDTSRTFTSAVAIGKDWLTLNVESQVDYLDAENAEISFGLQYDGLPRLNLANFVFDKVDEHLGIAQSAVQSGVDVIMGEVNKGLKGLDKILKPVSGNITEFLIEDYVDPILGQLYDDMAAAYADAEDEALVYDTFVLGKFVGHNPGDAYEITLTERFEYFFSGYDGHLGFVDRLLAELDAAIASVNALTPSFSLPNEQGIQTELRGLLAQDPDGNFDLLEAFATEMIAIVGADLAAGVLDEIDGDLREAINDATRPLIAVLEVLEGVKTELEDLREALEVPAAEFQAELQALLVVEGEGVDTMGDIATRAGHRMIALLRSLPPERSPFDDMTREEFVDIMREEIRLEFFDSDFHKQVVSALRARVYDVESRYRKGVDTMFAQVNKAIRDVLSEALNAIDEEVNGVVGDLEKYVGAGQIDGYAHIRGEDLERVRLDGAFQWKVPRELEFRGFLEIVRIPSTGNAMCDVVGIGPARKVTIGAIELPCGWMENDLRVNISTHFSFAQPNGIPFPVPIGLGGQFALSENSDPISFEAFEIYSLGAGVAFGATEGYIAAQAGLRFNNAEVFGGMFFGATCSLDPLIMVDPEVGNLLGEPPLIGGYMYGEGWIPILEYGCALNVAAGVGAGIFFFQGPETGPTYGMKMLLGVKGQAICAVTVRGEVRMLGMKRNDKFTASGSAKLVGELGACSFCIRHKIKVNVTYDDGDIRVKY